MAKKLGIKPGGKVFVQHAPANYRELLAPLPEGVKFVSAISSAVDVIHLFVKAKALLVADLEKVLSKMRPDAAIWVSWPKKASKVETDITEGTVRDVALPMGLVDIKVCAVDETWSGLKLVIRLENRSGKR